MMDKYSTDGFIATVLSASNTDGLWNVQPLIIEVDGTDHIEIEVSARDGMQPSIGDKVFILTMRNNLDYEEVNRYFGSSESNGVIVGIVQKTSGESYTLKGDYKFDGNVEVTEDLLVEGNVQIDGDLDVTGDVTITGSLTIGGIDYSMHTHLPGTYANAGGAVTGVSGAPI